METIASFPEATAAHLARALLESEGIEARVADEYTVGAYWLVSQAIGGVKLQVAPADTERARALLAEDRSALLAASDAGPAEELRCPRCGSSALRASTARRWSAVLSLVLFLPLVFGWRGQRCQACGQRWRPTRRPAGR